MALVVTVVVQDPVTVDVLDVLEDDVLVLDELEVTVAN